MSRLDFIYDTVKHQSCVLTRAHCYVDIKCLWKVYKVKSELPRALHEVHYFWLMDVPALNAITDDL
jgi:hypothetical protein